MRVLYVERGYIVKNLPQHVYHRWQRWLTYRDQDGFFEQSLDAAAVVTHTNLVKAPEMIHRGSYDWVVINWKQSGFTNEYDRAEAICKLFVTAKAEGMRAALFINAAQAQYLPPETVLDEADVIFKREPWRDRSRYPIREANQKKITPTMIHCPLVPSPKPHAVARAVSRLKGDVSTCANSEAEYDVGFSGADAAEHSLRRNVWQRVFNEGFSHIGGLQPNPNTKTPVPAQLQGPRFKGAEYRDALCAAKINLALKGIGEYTFRHQELLYLGKFMLSSPSIRELELPIPLEDGIHYVAFTDLDDMVEKIRYYLAHEDERLAIAKAGKELFDKYYDPARHGQDLFARLNIK